MRETYTRQKQPSADGLQNRCFPVTFVKFSEHLFFWQDDERLAEELQKQPCLDEKGNKG